MISPAFPRIVPDRDRYRKWYLDEDVTVHLANGDILVINKGYRYNGHSLDTAILLFGALFTISLILGWAYFAAVAGVLAGIAAYFKFRYKSTKDLVAALLHDYLIDTSPWHRYTRKFMDLEYERFMKMSIYQDSKWRAFLMPLAVKVYGYLRFTLWGDYRGQLKPNTKITVTVT